MALNYKSRILEQTIFNISYLCLPTMTACHNWPFTSLAINITVNHNSLSLRCHVHGSSAERLMLKAHKMGNAWGVSKSSSDLLNSPGFLQQPGNKPDHLCRRRKLSCSQRWTTNAYQDQINYGISKVCAVCSTIVAVNSHNLLELIIY